jgi:hypothetical protein
MKRKIILSLSFLIVSFSILWSCHNEDFAKGETEPQRDNANFFKHSQKGGLNARAGVDYISILEAYNREKDFLSTMPDQRGMPIWEKMQVVDLKNSTRLFIPISADNETLSSVLVASLDEENTVRTLQDVDNKMLEAFIYNDKNDQNERKFWMSAFLLTDSKAFGTQHYTNLPSDLYKDYVHGENNRMDIKGFEIKQDSKLMISTTCVTIWFCKNGKSYLECDVASGCSICWVKTFCETGIGDDFPGDVPIIPNSGSTSTPGTGGGSTTSTPTQQPPKDPCSLSSVFYRLAPGCGGGGGNPDLPTLDDPCEKINNMFTNIKFKEKVTAIDKPEVFDYDHEMGFASAYPVNTTVTDTQYQPMENTLGTHNVKLPDGNQYFGYIHSHNNESNGGTPIKIFSPSDLITFLTNCVRNADEHGSIGDAYCMVITSEGNYMLQYSGTGDYSIGPNQVSNWKTWYLKKYTQLAENEELTQSNIEKTFAQFLAESVNIPGLEVYHIEKNSGKASKLNTNGTKTPCP